MRGAAAVAAVAAVLSTTAVPAEAHAALTDASPAEDSTVGAPPRIVLTYSDPVRLPRVVVTDGSDRQYQSGPAQAVDNKVTQPLGGTLPDGRYTVAWRVVSSDGHPVDGTYTFTVRGSSGTAQPAAPAPPQAGAAPAEESGGSSGWLWIGLIALVVAAAAGTAAWLRRPRARD
ncbi:copper resistance protein CopC [Actinomadura sp. DSM 109109]|nr:copper resistance protein CopC [Actinomadura lepetitiana]